MSDAKERLKMVLPHLKIAMNMAKIEFPDGKVSFSVVGTGTDGVGKIITKMDANEFFNDLLHLVGYTSFEELLKDEE